MSNVQLNSYRITKTS